MNETQKNINVRWSYLIIGVLAMLFAGVLYAWSILKSPLSTEFGWSASELALNFTLAMSFFCIGGLLGANLAKKIGHRMTLIIAGILSFTGFSLTSALSGTSVGMLYLSYGVLAGLGIGISYNVVITTVSTWFPDKKGLCSGCLMMGFGASALIVGNIANALFHSDLGWRTTYVILGIALCIILVMAGLLLKKPEPSMNLPQPKAAKNTRTETFEAVDYTSSQMLRRASFWMAFTCLSFLAAVGSSVISFAKDLALSVNAPEALAVTLVGVLSICNGLGRILIGIIFDLIGRRRAMIFANVLTICAAGITLLAVSIGSLPLCIVGLCLTGISYGFCATFTAAFTSSFYGMKYFSTNMAFMTFNAMAASFIATLSNRVLEATGGYTSTFLMLLAMTIVSLFLNLIIRKP